MMSAGGSRPIIAALALMLVALWVPRVTLPRKTFDYVVVFDITQSMNVEDYDLDGKPISRLSFAREAARRALARLPCGSRVGWAAFAEYRTILLLAPIEVCANYSDLLASLERIDGRMRWANASEVTKGVYWAMRAARDVAGGAGDESGSQGPARVAAVATATRSPPGAAPDVIFITDGQEAPPLIGPGLPMFDDLKRGEIRGWILGAGGYTPRRIPRTDDDDKPIGFWHAEEVIQPNDVVGSDGRPSVEAGGAGESSPQASGPPGHEELSEVREPHLRALAQAVGFEYRHLEGADSLAEAMEDPRYARRTPTPTGIGWIPALAALIVLAIRFRP
jgi:mxaL protein